MIIKTNKLIHSLVIILMIVALFSSAFITVNADTINKTSSYKLTLNQAIDMAISSNLSIKNINEKIANADANLKYANKMAEYSYGKQWLTEAQHVSNLKEQVLVPKQKYNIWNNLQKEKEQTLTSLKLEATKYYFQELMLQKNIENSKNNIVRIQKDIKLKTDLLKKGREKQQTLDTLSIDLKEAEQKLYEVTRQSDVVKINLNNTLGLPLNSVLLLTAESVDDKQYSVDNIVEIIKAYIEKDFSYIKALTAQEEAQLEYDLVRKNTSLQSTDELEQLAENLQSCNNNVSEVSNKIEITIYTDYNNLLNLYDDIQINQYKLKLCSKQLDSYKVRLGLGQISQSDYNNKCAEYDGLGLALEQSKIDYHLALESFKNYSK